MDKTFPFFNQYFNRYFEKQYFENQYLEISISNQSVDPAGSVRSLPDSAGGLFLFVLYYLYFLIVFSFLYYLYSVLYSVGHAARTCLRFPVSLREGP